jgi:hypothetical protein
MITITFMRANSIYDAAWRGSSLGVQPASQKRATKEGASIRGGDLGKPRTWLSLIVFCTLLVAGSALAFAVVIAGASVALASHQSTTVEEAQDIDSASVAPPSGKTFSGMITDSHCGPRHMRNTSQNSTDCARACVRKGATYVLVDGAHRYTLIGDDSALAQLAGERANVTGTRQGDTIIVNAAAPIF